MFFVAAVCACVSKAVNSAVNVLSLFLLSVTKVLVSLMLLYLHRLLFVLRVPWLVLHLLCGLYVFYSRLLSNFFDYLVVPELHVASART